MLTLLQDDDTLSIPIPAGSGGNEEVYQVLCEPAETGGAEA